MYEKILNPSLERITRLDEVETYSLPLDELEKKLKTDLKQGLTQKDVEERQRLLGINSVPKVTPNIFRIYITPLLNWLINIYLIVSTILALIGLFILPEVWGRLTYWLIAISANCILAIIQQMRAQRRIEALHHLIVPKSKVVREGKLNEIPSEQIVIGDILKLEEGDRVPADARIITASFLKRK